MDRAEELSTLARPAGSRAARRAGGRRGHHQLTAGYYDEQSARAGRRARGRRGRHPARVAATWLTPCDRRRGKGIFECRRARWCQGWRRIMRAAAPWWTA